MSYPLPKNELQRLKALADYAILDTPAEQIYDDYTFIAAQICQVPTALISLVDEHRQWFKSRVGLEAQETSRDVAFCAYTILDDQVMIVPDACKDSRFAENPLVTDSPKIHFYAGAPLVTPEGYGIGTLCIIDYKPHKFSDAQKQALEGLARQLIAQLELRKKSKALREAIHKIKALEELIPICAYCKSIRNDKDFWIAVDKYLIENNIADLTHSICPVCMEKHFSDL